MSRGMDTLDVALPIEVEGVDQQLPHMDTLLTLAELRERAQHIGQGVLDLESVLQ